MRDDWRRRAVLRRPTEEWEDRPEGYPQTPPDQWWNWHDQYEAVSSPQE